MLSSSQTSDKQGATTEIESAIALRKRKNCQSRQRSEMLREQVAEIKGKAAEFRTAKETEILETREERKLKKNNRSKQRLVQQKDELTRILNKPSSRRAVSEIQFLKLQLYRKMRKNDGDKLRRLRKRSGNCEELKLPPIPRGESLVAAPIPQLGQIENIDIPDYELFVPSGYGDEEGAADATSSILLNYDIDYGGFVQGTVGENMESVLDNRVGEEQLPQETATEEKLPLSSLVLQQSVNLTPLPTAPLLLSPPLASYSVPILPLILPPHPSSYRQQNNCISPRPGPIGTTTVMPPYYSSSLIAHSGGAAVGLSGGGMVDTMYQTPLPQFQDCFYHNRLPWALPPASNLTTCSTPFGGGGQNFVHHHPSFADQAAVVANMVTRQRQERHQSAMLARAFNIPNAKEQQACASPQASIDVVAARGTSASTEDTQILLVNSGGEDNALLKAIVAMTTPLHGNR